MSESRSNQAGQTGMAILILFGVLVLGAGGVLWLRVRAQREATLDQMRMVIYQEQIAREQAEAAMRTAEEARNVEHEKRENGPAVSSAADAAPAVPNEPESADNSEVQTP